MQRVAIVIARAVCAVCALAALLFSSANAWADRPGGVTAQTLSLPSGPASLKGLGESFQPNAATGTGSYAVPLLTPPGFLAPSITLSYAGGRGRSELGQGWRLSGLQVYRQTDKGAPDFDEDDRFCVSGDSLNDELVLVNEKLRYYRLKNEGANALFVRDAGEDSWTIRHADGEISSLGSAEESREKARGKTSRWFLDKHADRFGHWTEYHYFTDSGRVYLDEVVYQLHAAADYQNTVAFAYEDRPDVFTDYTYGDATTTAQRLASVEMFHGGRLVRTYRLGYDDALLFSLLKSVELTGEDGLKVPTLTLGYLQDSTEGGELVTVRNAPPLDAVVDGWGELADVNADGLPDVVTTRAGDYRYYENVDGRSFGSVRTLRNSPDHDLTEPGVVFADLNGDGFRDLVHPQGDHFRYYPGGDIKNSVLRGFLAPVELQSRSDGFLFTSPELKLGDQNHDGRIDLLWQKPGQDSWLISGADNVLREQVTPELPADVDFEDPRVELTDFNGDGLLDFVRRDIGLDSSTVWVWYGLGHGEFTASKQVPGAPRGDPSEFHLLDVNHDGQADLLRISGSWATIHVNRGSLGFSGARGNFQGLPAASETSRLLFADMNGNGTTDVVWVTTDFKLRYLELSGEPYTGLLSRIDNGMGFVSEVAYRSSTEYAVEAKTAGKPWIYPLATPVPVVSEVRTTDSLDVIGFRATETRSSFAYRDGYYDGKEHEFRGFGAAEVTALGDETHDSLVAHTRFHVGLNPITLADEEVLKGKPLSASEADQDGNVLASVEAIWQAEWLCQEAIGESVQVLPRCQALGDLTGKKDQLVAVALASSSMTASIEKSSRPRFTFVSSEFDAWGSPIRVSHLGEVKYAGAYQPGEPLDVTRVRDVPGDEEVTVNKYLRDVGEWLIGLPTEEQLQNTAGDVLTRERTFYDGLAFGKARLGLVTRETEYDADGARWVTVESSEYDSWGNEIASVDAVGDRVEYDYDAQTALFKTAERVEIASGDFLRFGADYDFAYGAMTRATDPNGNASRFSLDGLGRVSAIYDALHSLPVSAFEYSYGTPKHPVSKTRIRRLQEVGGSYPQGRYHTTLAYTDGTGKLRQQKDQAEAPLGWVASGWTVFSARGEPVVEFDNFSSSSSELELPPAATPRATSYRDARGRVVRGTVPPTEDLPDGGETVTQFFPFETRSYNERESTDGDFANPEITRFDGLGRVVEVEKYNDTTDGQQRLRWRVQYDARGEIVRFADPQWNGREDDSRHLRRYTYDALGRLKTVEDPNAGRTDFQFDDLDRVVWRQDALGQTQEWTFGKAGRLSERKVTNAALGAPDYYRYHYDAAAPASPLSDVSAAATNLRGELAWIEFPTGQEHFAFDVLGRQREQATRLWNPATSAADNQQRDVFRRLVDYRADGQIVRTTLPGGLSLSTAYNERAAPTAQAATLGGVTRSVTDSVAYDARGAEVAATGGNRIKSCLRYNARSELTGFMALDGSDAGGCSQIAQPNRGYQHLDYVRGHDGLLEAVQDLSSSTTGLPRLDVQYAYDSIRQLVGAEDARGKTTYTYDSIQNLVRRDVERDIAEGPTGAFAYGESGAGPNALTTAGGKAYGYDAAGQMRQYNGYDLRFDAEGQLVRASNPDKGISIVQYYDDDGDRRLSLVYRQGKPVKVYRYVAEDYHQLDGEDVWFVGDNSIRAEVVKSKGVAVDAYLLDQLTTYVSGNQSGPKPLPEEYMDLNGDGRRLDAADLQVASQGYQQEQRVGGERVVFRYSTRDQLGGTTHQTDSAGALISNQRFYPYGRVASSSGTRSFKGYTGVDAEPEPDLGLQRIGARYYAAALGRWVTPDRLIGERPHLMLSNLVESNLYSYAGNNPAMAVDPDGQIVVVVVVVVFVGFTLGGPQYANAPKQGEKTLRKSNGQMLREKIQLSMALRNPAAVVKGMAQDKAVEEAKKVADKVDPSGKLSTAIDAGVAIAQVLPKKSPKMGVKGAPRKPAAAPKKAPKAKAAAKEREARATGTNANGQATNSKGEVLGSSGKPMHHHKQNKNAHQAQRSAQDASAKGAKAMNHPDPSKGDPHSHATKKQGGRDYKRNDQMHQDYKK